jgi:F-type H+-transporting ATPase subunit b
MLAFAFNIIFLFAEGGTTTGGFDEFYNTYLNYPGFEAWKFFNLTIFVLILVYLVKKPLSNAFKAKREAIRAELIKAEEEKQAALAELTSAEAKIVNLESEKNEVIENAKREAEEEKARIAEQTSNEIAKMRNQADSEVERLSKQTKLQLRRFSAEESVRLAEEKIRARMNEQTDSQLVKSSIQSIGGLN